MVDLALEINQEQPSVHASERLPTELLELIFLEAYESGQSSESRYSLDVRTFPWIAGQVSIRWRRVALLLGHMWSDVRMNFSDMGYRVGGGPRGAPLSKYSVEILREHLLRSRGFPLKVTISSNTTDKGDNRDVANLLAVIGAYSHQWKEANLYIEPNYLTYMLLGQINGHLSQLETLHWAYLPPTFSSIVAPNLSDITVPKMLVTQSFSQWSRFKRVCLRHTTADETLHDLQVLQACQELVHLTVDMVYFIFPPQPELTFEHIRFLHCPVSLLPAFSKLPALEHLFLYHTVQNLAPFPEFVQRIAPLLKELTLPSVYGPRNSSLLTDALSMLPGLETLGMFNLGSYGSAWTAVVNLLQVDPNRPDSAPLLNLQHLSIRTTENAPAERESCIAMIESRCSDQYDLPRFKSVQWHNTGTALKTRRMAKSLAEMTKRGLEIIQQP
ncbi:hypothetical protein C8J56DRAFT_1169001 [Mycena floridula]|nr:hypothetical protein C8J56DRAFT_1169001 [Mycena floridula]